MKKRAKPITLDHLATMVAKGFAETANKAETATKQDITDMSTKKDIADMATKQDIAKLDERIADLAERIGRVEAKLDRALYKEIARLEELIHQMANKLHVKLEY